VKNHLLLLFILLSLACKTTVKNNTTAPIDTLSLLVLGNVQDGGSPHIGCKKTCCKALFEQPDPSRKVVSLGIIDPENKKTYIFEATPDFTTQIKYLARAATFATKETPDGIFLTHAHIGHYAGLMFLGREAMNASKVPVYAMPKMKQFLENNGPWGQLVHTNNIAIQSIFPNQRIELTPNLAVTPLLVPHRDEYSETVGYIIEGISKKVLFIPDIDKWEKWNTQIVQMIGEVDYAFIDATFFDAQEINNRNIAEIPHPFVIESMNLFKNLPTKEKNKVHFIHFNHTNPLLDASSKQSKVVLENGFHIARMGDMVKL
jgi:pyrroloquinoline quinone biosynthesis protein B